MLIALLSLATLHAPDGARIDVNTLEVSSVRDPRQGQFASGVHCILVMTNRSYISVSENCDEVRMALRGRSGPCALVCGETTR